MGQVTLVVVFLGSFVQTAELVELVFVFVFSYSIVHPQQTCNSKYKIIFPKFPYTYLQKLHFFEENNFTVVLDLIMGRSIPWGRCVYVYTGSHSVVSVQIIGLDPK